MPDELPDDPPLPDRRRRVFPPRSDRVQAAELAHDAPPDELETTIPHESDLDPYAGFDHPLEGFVLDPDDVVEDPDP